MAGSPPGSWLTEERLEREAKALSAVKTGQMTQNQASKAFGIPKGTLCQRIQWFEQTEPEEKRRWAEERLLDATMVNALAATELIGEKLTDPDEASKLTVKELVPIAGMSMDKLALIRGWGKQQTGDSTSLNALQATLAQVLGSGGSVTIEGPKPDHKAIDVESQEQD